MSVGDPNKLFAEQEMAQPVFLMCSEVYSTRSTIITAEQEWLSYLCPDTVET